MLTNTNNHLMLNDRTYAFFKWLIQIFLPAFSALYFGLGQIWGFPAIENVVGSIAVLTVFLAAILGISSAQYNKSGAAYDGQIVVTPQLAGPTQFSLELDGDPRDIVNKESIQFRVCCEDPLHDHDYEPVDTEDI